MLTKEQWEKVTAEIRAMQPHMKEMADILEPKPRLDSLVKIAEFIGKADLLECTHIINELIERVSELTGSASELEDASCALTKAIKDEENDCDGREWKTCPCYKCQDIRSQQADNAYERERDRRMGL